jgi:hypothetical protein
MVPAFERTKTVHALDRAATVIGVQYTAKHKSSWLGTFISRYVCVKINANNGLEVKECNENSVYLGSGVALCVNFVN